MKPQNEQFVYIVRGDLEWPWDYQVYGVFSDFGSAMARAAKMVAKTQEDNSMKNIANDFRVEEFLKRYDTGDDDWTGLLIEKYKLDDATIPNGYGDSCYSACKDSHEVAFSELEAQNLI